MDSIFTEWPGGSLESALRLGGLVLLSYALVLWFSAIIWTYSDIRHRTPDLISQAIAVLLVAVFNVPGLVIYLVIRPQTTIADAYERSLETEAVLHELQLTANSCQTCRRPVDDDFNICPHCRTVLRESCRSCARSIRTSWVACPYCATDRPIPIPPEPRRQPRRGRQERVQAERSARTQPLERPRRSDQTPSLQPTAADSGPAEQPAQAAPAQQATQPTQAQPSPVPPRPVAPVQPAAAPAQPGSAKQQPAAAPAQPRPEPAQPGSAKQQPAAAPAQPATPRPSPSPREG